MFFTSGGDKPQLPKALEHWFQDLPSIERLREILADPVFQTACATLVQAALPSQTAVHTGQTNSEKLCWLAGYSDFARDLAKLTRILPPKADLEEWAHLLPQNQ